MNADGCAVSRFTTIGATSPVWSPDGSKIAFTSPIPEVFYTYHPLEVFVAAPDGGNVRMVTRDPWSTFGPCWSGDGASIVFGTDHLGVGSNIFQVDLNGSNLKRLTARKG